MPSTAAASGFDTLYYGALLVLVVHQVAAFARRRDPARLAFVGFVVSLAFSSLAWGGVGFGAWVPTSLGHDADAWNRSLLVIADAAVALFAALLARGYLRTRHNARNLDPLLRAVVVLASVSVLLARPDTWALGFELVGLVSLVGPPILLGVGVAAWRSGFAAARPYLLAHACLLAGLIVGGLASETSSGVLAWSAMGPAVGTVAMACAITYGLAQRQRLMELAVDQREAERAAAAAAEDPHDAATGLWNRRHFDDHVQTVWRRAVREDGLVSLLRLEIDSIAPVEPAEDSCLQRVARALAGVAGESANGRLARYGENEFAVVLPGFSAKDAEQMGEAMRAAVEDLAIPREGSGAGRLVTVSVGVGSAVPENEIEPKRLLDLVDQALQAARRLGRNRVCRAGLTDGSAG